jgi:glycolate oxidase iron-sulfur subunit
VAATPSVKAPHAANLDCIHCGLCLSVCPTYIDLGSEVDSPRGRIYLMRAMEAGRIAPTSASLQKHLDLCLECRACETACPSGVTFSLMMNDARAAILRANPPARGTALVRRLVFQSLLPSRAILHAGFRLLRLYQRSGLQKLVRASGVLRLFPKRLGEMEALLPDVPPAPGYRLPDKAPSGGRGSAALFEGCIMPELFGPVHEATVRVLERNDIRLCRPGRQTCCGALHLHAGEVDLARDLARTNIDAFENDGAAAIVVNAAGCGAMLKEYAHLLENDDRYAARARAFTARVQDISEYLDRVGLVPPSGRVPLKATYDDPCHLLHGQGVKAAPRNLLARIPGLEIVELQDSDRCCGSAGIYNITQPEMSGRVLAEKMNHLARTGADVVASGNPGCLIQLCQGIRSRGLAMKAVHPVELLDQAYRAAGSPPR